MFALAEPGTFVLFALAALWVIPWKGWALWLAAKNTHKWWFIALLVINTVAILDIIYIFAIGRPVLKKSEGLYDKTQREESHSPV